MAIDGWIIFAISTLIIAFCMSFAVVAEKGFITAGVVSFILIIILFLLLWYKPNPNDEIERIVKVYDIEGELVQEYDGKFFDIKYDDNRILFDDENGKRHIIYYPIGTVIIDEK